MATSHFRNTGSGRFSPPSSNRTRSRSTDLRIDPLGILKAKADRLQITPEAGQSSRPSSNQPRPSNTNLSFDPRQLLNPKNYRQPTSQSKKTNTEPPSVVGQATASSKAPAEMPEFVFDSGASGGNFYDNNDDEGDLSMGTMIEKTHNIAEREERPFKRQKIDESSNGVHNFNGGKGGEISDYIRTARQDGAELSPLGTDAESPGSKNELEGEYDTDSVFENGRGEASLDPEERAKSKTIVDLTMGEDNEDIAIVDSKEVKRDEGETMVCFGLLEGAMVVAFKVPSPDRKKVGTSKNFWPAIKCTLQRLPGRKHLIIVVRDAEGNDFGNLDARTAMGLVPLMDSQVFKIRTDVRVNPRVRKPFDMPGLHSSDRLALSLVIYGQRKHGEAIGKHLSQKNLWLRTPGTPDAQNRYFNPQVAAKLGKPRASTGRQSSSLGYSTRSTEEMRSDMLGLFDSLQKSESLPEMEPDSRIMTPLLQHQKQALYFMSAREKAPNFDADNDDVDGSSNNCLWKSEFKPNGQKVYYHVLSGHEQRNVPEPVLGGILADMMGLGKTLSILSLISSTLENAVDWAETSQKVLNENGVEMRNVKTTLLVCPLSVISNWEEQLASHIRPEAFSYYVYHGGSRCHDMDILSTKDVIITTYSIVSSELYRRKGKPTVSSPFLNMNFFRVVLDEAHMIREQLTLVSQAICSLESSRKWAVTGTPIQNRLDDLGALVKFLRVKPFDTGFAQYILAPFKNADPEILPKLRLLVGSLTLRRLKDKINLPERHDEIVRLRFSKDEQELYDWFAKDAGNRVRAMSTTKQNKLAGKGYHHILRSIMCLRLISAHGKELLNEEDLKMVEGLSSNNAIDVDDEDTKPAINDRQAYEMLGLFQETNTDICAQCARKVAPKEIDEEKDSVIGTMLPCYQLICNDCDTQAKKNIEKRTRGTRFKCPFCDEILKLSFFQLTQSGIDKAEEAKARARENPKQAKMMGRYMGPHSKTSALISALMDTKAESTANPHEPPIKSVVFSGWTTHLDLIQIALEDNNLQAVRLDGKMTRPKRKLALDAFRDDPSVLVILVSIGAGGLGLNLTSASRVYVMEPQYNPAAEAQAVDRVHRLGQTRAVTCTRYVMEGSIEERMLVLQKKKTDLAELSIGKGRLDRAEAAKEKLEELKSLFR